jgi:hypothetical protein
MGKNTFSGKFSMQKIYIFFRFFRFQYFLWPNFLFSCLADGEYNANQNTTFSGRFFFSAAQFFLFSRVGTPGTAWEALWPPWGATPTARPADFIQKCCLPALPPPPRIRTNRTGHYSPGHLNTPPPQPGPRTYPTSPPLLLPPRSISIAHFPTPPPPPPPT